MRLISQSGMKDIPYDNKEMRVADLAENLHSIIVGMYVVGDYSSKEKALKVMEMIRKWSYSNDLTKLGGGNIHDYETYFQMPQDNEVILD